MRGIKLLVLLLNLLLLVSAWGEKTWGERISAIGEWVSGWGKKIGEWGDRLTADAKRRENQRENDDDLYNFQMLEQRALKRKRDLRRPTDERRIGSGNIFYEEAPICEYTSEGCSIDPSFYEPVNPGYR